jgi:hypothetical protein
MQLLTTEPLWLSGTLLLGVAILLAMASPVLVRRRVSLDRLRVSNEVAGFRFATVGVLYAVLLASAVIVVWEKFSEAEDAVAQEAGAAATLYRLADGGRPPLKWSALRYGSREPKKDGSHVEEETQA